MTFTQDTTNVGQYQPVCIACLIDLAGLQLITPALWFPLPSSVSLLFYFLLGVGNATNRILYQVSLCVIHHHATVTVRLRQSFDHLWHRSYKKKDW